MQEAEASTSSGESSTSSTKEETASEATENEASSADEQSVDWESLALDEGEEEVAREPAETAPPPPVQPASEVETPPAQEPQAQQPAPQPPQPTPPPPPMPEAPVKTQQELEAEARAATENYQKELVKQYALPEEMAQQLQTEPEAVLPTLAAQVHMHVERSVMARIGQQLPQYLNAMQSQNRAEAEAKETFYGRWPELKNYEQQVLTVGQMFRATNPNATAQEALERVGAMVYMALGKPVPGAAPAAAPGTPPAAKGAGFRPAMPGAGGGAPASKESNPFANLAEEFLREDQGE